MKVLFLGLFLSLSVNAETAYLLTSGDYKVVAQNDEDIVLTPSHKLGCRLNLDVQLQSGGVYLNMQDANAIHLLKRMRFDFEADVRVQSHAHCLVPGDADGNFCRRYDTPYGYTSTYLTRIEDQGVVLYLECSKYLTVKEHLGGAFKWTVTELNLRLQHYLFFE